MASLSKGKIGTASKNYEMWSLAHTDFLIVWSALEIEH